MNQVMTALEVNAEDWPRFIELREELREMLKKNLNPCWKFVHESPDPEVQFQGCLVIPKVATNQQSALKQHASPAR